MAWALLISLLGPHAIVGAERAATPGRSLAVFKTASEDASLVELAAAIDTLVAAHLNSRTDVTVSARPALDLAGLQLALGCAGSGEACLRSSTEETGAASLLAPALRNEHGSLVFDLLHYEPGRTPPVRVVQRRYLGERPADQALAGVAGMLDELFAPELAPEPQPTAAGELAGPLDPQPKAAEAPDQPRFPWLPLAVSGLGVALVVTGTAFGLSASANESSYRKIDVRDRRSADRAIERLHSAQSQADAANVTLGLGAAVLGFSAVLWYLQLSEGPPEVRADAAATLRVSGAIGAGVLGLDLRGAWNDSL